VFYKLQSNIVGLSIENQVL